MRRSRCLSGSLGILALLVNACAPDSGTPSAADAPPAERVHAWFAAELEGVVDAVDGLEAELVGGVAGPGFDAEVQAAFAQARERYKRVEHLLAYTSPTAAAELNGPALPKVEEDDPSRFEHPPEGFQVLEELLFPRVRHDRTDDIANELGILRNNLRRVVQLTSATTFGDGHVWDAARLGVVRVATLGIAGFDSPVALHSLREGRSALLGVRDGLLPYRPALELRDPLAWRRLDSALEDAARFLEQAPGFDELDRVSFHREHVPGTLVALDRARVTLEVEPPRQPRALRADATHLFAADAFDLAFFAPPGGPPPTAARVELGRHLFFDPVLSGDGERSCATCHLPERAFTDGLARSRPLASAPDALLRNAPTLINSGLQQGSFYDLRTRYLEDQVAEVVRDRAEMHGDLAAAARRIADDPGYAALLARAADPGGSGGAGASGARGPHARPGVDGDELRWAVAAYVRSLVGLSSRFDRYLRGESVRVSDAEKRGFNLFMGRAGCGTCHFAPLFNGTVPPVYDEAEVEVLGVPASPEPGRTRVDADPGRQAVHGIELHRHAFKTPTVRNAELTAPYMHNGVYDTLEEVVDFYDGGGGAGLGITIAHQTLPPDSLRLTPRDKADLIEFMRALTDTTGLSARPGSGAPASADPAGRPT